MQRTTVKGPTASKMTKNDVKLKNKLDETHRRGCEMTEESLRATNEMLRLILQCEHAGASTLASIHAQGEQLVNTEAGLDSIHENLEKAGVDLTKIERRERCCCCCSCCPSCGSKSEDAEIWKTGTKDVVITSQPKSQGKHLKSNGSYINRITNDKAEDQMERNLAGVSSHLGGLKAIAEGMNTSVSKQNSQIDRMNTKGDSNNARLDKETKRTTELLKT